MPDYNSAHTGPEIDEAISRALPGGGIDQEMAQKEPAIESADYPGCYYRMVDGAQEWINPPMAAGVEYRTTERYDGKVVTRKLVNCGAIANRKTVQLVDNSKYRIISANVRLGSAPIPYWHNGAVGTGGSTNVWNAYFNFGGAAITLYCGDSAAEAAQTVLAEVRLIPA